MRQQLKRPRGISSGSVSHMCVLGLARRVSKAYRHGADDEPMLPVSPRANGLQCIQSSTTGPLPLGIRSAVLPSPDRIESFRFERWSRAVPGVIARGPRDAPTSPLPQSPDQDKSGTQRPSLSALLAQSTGTAKVLDALAGGDLEPAAFVDAIVAPVDRDIIFEEADAGPVEADVAPVEATEAPAGLGSREQTADDEGPAAAFGPRLSPALEPCHAGAFGGLSGSPTPSEDSAPVEGGAVTADDRITADNDLAATTEDVADWLGRTMTGTPSALALAEELDAQVKELQDELMTAVDGASRWPQDTVNLAEPVGCDGELIGAAVLNEDGALVSVDTPEPPSLAARSADRAGCEDGDDEPSLPSQSSIASDPSLTERPTASAEPTSGRDPTADTSQHGARAGSQEDPQEETAARPKRSTRSAWIASRFAGRWRGRGRPTAEALRMERQEAFRKAFGKRQGGSEASSPNGQQADATMMRSSNIDWKPGDPFAARRRPRNRQFRWRTMLLTAGGVAGVGYVALRLLLVTGNVGG